MADKEPVHDLDDATLVEKLKEAKEEAFNLRFQHVTGQLDNSASLRRVRKDVARYATELRAREIAAADELAASKENS
jgi:large subunit ribosomal protein L29